MKSSAVVPIVWMSILTCIGRAEEINLTNIGRRIHTHYGFQETNVTFTISASQKCALTKVKSAFSSCETQFSDSPTKCSEFKDVTVTLHSNAICDVTFHNLSEIHDGLWKMQFKDYGEQKYVYFHLHSLDQQYTNLKLPEIIVKDCQLPNVAFYGGDIGKPGDCADPSVSKCQDLCQENTQCLAWATPTKYTMGTHFCCYLKEEIDLVYVNDERHSGFDQCPSCVKDNTTIQNPLRTIPVKRYSTCQENCTSDPECHHFAYVIPKLPLIRPWPLGVSTDCILGGSQSKEIPSQERTLWQPKQCPNGIWSQWSDFSECSRKCSGHRFRLRNCTLKNFEGQECEGPWKTEQKCSIWDEERCDEWIRSQTKENIEVPAQTSSVGLWIICLLFIVVITICIVAFGLWSKKRRAANPNEQKLDLLSSKSSKKTGPKSVPIPIADFRHRVRNSLNPYKNEFIDLDNDDFHLHNKLSKSLGQAHNRLDQPVSLNRYSNILPYDHSIVRLQENLLGTHYINASFIHEIDDNLIVIATQGPTEETIPHFLKMICENSVQFVIMLTNHEEECTSTGETLENSVKYWANVGTQPAQFGPFQLSTHSKKHVGIRLLQRRCTIRHKRQKHSFEQIQFEDWLDSNSPDHLVHGTTVIRQLIPQTRKTTIVVHCSGGVGRTGLFLGLFKLMKDIDNQTPTLDVYGTVLAMRRDRNFMVQTEAQYKYLYLCTERYLRQKDGSDDHYEPDYVYTN